MSTRRLVPPLRPDHVPRPALVERLRRGLDGRLTLVVAPAGFGKTTALAEVFAALDAEEESPSRAFLALDPADAEPERFEHRLRRVLDERPAIVALDDFHLVDAVPAILDALASRIEDPADGPRWVIASRRRPEWPLARWRGRGLLVEVDSRALRFAETETRAFFRARLGRDLAASITDALHRRAEGWPAVLQLVLAAGSSDAELADALGTRSGPHPASEHLASEHLAEFLVSEVLDQLDAGRRRLLENLSVLDAFSPPLAAAVTIEIESEIEGKIDDAEDPGEVLADLERSHLPIVRLDAEGHWLRFHPLFGELLARRLERRGDAADIHGRASQYFDAEGDGERAVEHALAAGDPEWTEAVLTRHARDLVDRGEGLVVARAVERLGRPLESLDGPLLGHLGWAALLLHRPETLRRALDALDARHASGRLEAEPTARLLGLHGVAARARGDLAAARRHFTDALDAAPADDPPLRATLALQLGIALTFALELERAAEVFELCLELDTDPASMTRLGALSCLAQVRAEQGRLGLAESLCREALAVDEHAPRARPAEALVLRTLGRVHLERGEFRRAAARLDEAAERSKDSGFDELVALVALWQGELARATGDRGALDRALATLDRLPTRDRLPPLQRLWQRALRLHRALDAGDLDAARTHVAPRPEGSPVMADIALRVAVARADAMTGDEERACSGLDALVDFLRERGSREGELGAGAWRSWIDARAGRRSDAVRATRRLLARAADEGHVRPFAAVPTAEWLPVLDEAARDLPASRLDHGRRVLEAARARHRDEPTAIDLTSREHEVLRLLADGLPNRRIAESLGVAPSTVKTHLRHLFDKLDARRRTQAVARGRALGLV